ncbi:uncharacterized protein LOC117327401 [Pecten maximus]|uniref:uncharacterized protein LOC117327401 n=1 Tax=Pecten maximus TaxID=6579 RepID=UPI001458CCBE|nr:uncharacterized protein LOC117327401 [Pecten maximus]XP_033740247.1 uncharacterized protein LOC117327401 [Pecten maximus]XP_033740248.1 uncharacterized protein LOC117327401 [Pecten maximus]XP_033740249.1 uncharacterized protein LOC117327401 [Pecten maximus]
MGNEPSKRPSSKTGIHDTHSSNGQHVHRKSHDESTELSGIHGDHEDLGKIDILQSDTENTSATVKTLLQVANDLHVTDNVSSITASEVVDNSVLKLQDNEVSSSAITDDVKESSTDGQTDTHASPSGEVVDHTDTPSTTSRKDTPTTPGKDDSGVESSSDIVQVSGSGGGSKDSSTKSKANKKSKKSDNSKKANKSKELNIEESINDEVISLKKDKKKKPKKKISKQNSTVSDVGMTSTVSMSSGLNVSGVSSDAGRGTLERSVSSIEPGFVVVNSKENKNPRRPLSKSFSDIEQQKEKKKKKKTDKKKSSTIAPIPVPVENTNKEKRRSIFEEDFTVELGLGEDNLDVVSLSSLSSVEGNVEVENDDRKDTQETVDQQDQREEIVKSRNVSEYNLTFNDASIEEDESAESVENRVVYERKITIITHEPVLSEKNNIETGEPNNNYEVETKDEITHKDSKTDALNQISINYSSEDEDVDETVDDMLGNFSLVDQIVAKVSREYECAPQETLTDRYKNGVRRIGHSHSMSPSEGGKLHRPIRRQYSENVTRTRISNSFRQQESDDDVHDYPRRVILTRPLSFDYPSSSSSSSLSSKPSKRRQNSFSEMLKKSTNAFTHQRRKSENKGEPLKEQNVGKSGDGQTTTIVYM